MAGRGSAGAGLPCFPAPSSMDWIRLGSESAASGILISRPSLRTMTDSPSSRTNSATIVLPSVFVHSSGAADAIPAISRKVQDRKDGGAGSDFISGHG